MQIREYQEADTLRLAVDGTIDRLSSQAFMDSVISAFRKSKKVVIDMENVTYISSAGLRVFIIGQKTADNKGGSLSLINVTAPVYDVLFTTGFNQVLDITRIEKT